LGFKAVQIGPLVNYDSIEGESLNRVLDSLNMERNVHVGGICDANRFAKLEEEYVKVQKEIRFGIMLSSAIRYTLVSVHPPLFVSESKASEDCLARARERFFELLTEEADFASRKGVTLALESFCYSPFIFRDLVDFLQFIAGFSLEKLGILLDVGHVYQAGINLEKAVRLCKERLLDVHIHDATLERDYRRATHLPIGKGTVDFSKLIGLLKEVGYNRWLTLEIRGSEREVVASKRFLEKLIKRTC
jgi:sugar phosphate isomerase/epimerase